MKGLYEFIYDTDGPNAILIGVERVVVEINSLAAPNEEAEPEPPPASHPLEDADRETLLARVKELETKVSELEHQIEEIGWNSMGDDL